MRRFAGSLCRQIERLEETKLPPFTWLLIFLSIVVLRNVLESFSGDRIVFDFPSFFIHFPLAYVAPLFTLAILLSVLARVRVERVTRFMLFAWMLTLLPPAIDLLLGRGGVKVIGYLPLEPGGFLPVLFSFFNPGVTLVGTTPGIRLEALLAALLAAGYVFLRSRSLLRTLVTPIAIFLASFCFFTLPYIFINLANLFNPELGSVTSLYWRSGLIVRHLLGRVSYSVALLDTLLILPILSGWFYLYSRERFIGELKLTPWLPSAWWVSMVGLGLIVGWRLFPSQASLHPFDILSGLALALAVFFAHQFCTRLPISSERSRLLPLVYLSFALLLSGCVNYTPLVFTLLFVAFGLLYWLPPIELRRFAILSRFILGMASLSAAAIGFSAFSSGLTPDFLPRQLLLILLLALPLGILSRNLPQWMGEKLGKVSSGGLLLVSFLLVSFFLRSFLLSVFAIFLSIQGFLRLKERTSLVSFWATSSIYGGLGFFILIGGLSPPEPPLTSETIHHLYQGTLFESSRMWDHAAEEYKIAVQEGWEEDETFLSLGVCHQEEGRFEEAERWYRKAIEANPELLPAYNNLGVVLRELGDYEGSLKVLKEGLELDPGSARIHYNLFFTLQSMGKTDEVVPRIRAYLQLNPDDLRAQGILGDVHLRRGEPREALAQYEKILMREPRNSQVLTKAGIARVQLGDETGALSSFERARSRDPDNVVALLNLGYIYANQGLDERAIQLLERALQLSPQLVGAHHRLGYIYMARAAWDKGVYHLERCAELEPGVANHYDSMGELHFERGELGKASEWYRRALEIDSAFANPYFMLGTIARREKRNVEARHLFRHFIELESSQAEPNQEKIQKGEEYLRGGG